MTWTVSLAWNDSPGMIPKRDNQIISPLLERTQKPLVVRFQIWGMT